jgi:xylulokinase
MKSLLLSLDLGTTHSKAGLFSLEGRLLKTANRKAVIHRNSSGNAYYEPGELHMAVLDLLQEITRDIDTRLIAVLGIASMAETGLLIDRRTAEPKSHLIPWFDNTAAMHVDTIKTAGDPQERFFRTGIRPNFKCALAKLIDIKRVEPNSIAGSVWLNTADYIAQFLTGHIFTDYSLAGRTYAFRIDQITWDVDWLETFGIPADLFPPVVPSGKPIGQVSKEAALQTGLKEGTPVSICGHDHVCAAFTGIGIETGSVFDSMGTAEALVGYLNKEELGVEEFNSGLVFGRYVAGGNLYWMGGMSASGGSIEWLRGILGDPPLIYREMETLLEESSPGPTGILYFPYLSGSGSPHTDVSARGAFVGLQKNTSRSDMVKAVLEGVAYEAEFIRRTAEILLDNEITSIIASGGGSRVKPWLQIKADISGCEIKVPTISEATLLGAALVAGIGVGLYAGPDDARSMIRSKPIQVYQPIEANKLAYRHLYENGFLPLQAPLRHVFHKLAEA